MRSPREHQSGTWKVGIRWDWRCTCSCLKGPASWPGRDLGLSAPPSELARLDLNNHRGWFCEQGHRGFKGEKGEPGLPGLDGLDAPCPLVWPHPPLPAWLTRASPRVWFSSACLSGRPPTHTPLAPSLSPPWLVPRGSRHAPSSMQFAKMLSWLLPEAASKAPALNVSHPTAPPSQLWLHLILLSQQLLALLPPEKKLGKWILWTGSQQP